MFMNQTDSFDRRYSLSQFLFDNIKSIFNSNEVELVPFGFEKICGNNVALDQFIKTPEANLSHSAMIVKFAPDFILLKKTHPQQLFFVEIKVSVTPLCSQTRLDEIRMSKGANIRLSDVGDIAREAWNSYNNLYPNTIIIDGCSYNNKVLMAQFVKNIRCLRCYKTPSLPYDCNQCPMKKRSFFEVSRNYMSSGSQTPHTNIDYSSFMNITDFFNSLGISTNQQQVDKLIATIKSFGISFSSRTYPDLINKTKFTLIKEGITWIK